MPDQHAVILLAGGSGSRMGSDQAKQFIRVAGKPVLVHSFDALRQHLPEALARDRQVVHELPGFGP